MSKRILWIALFACFIVYASVSTAIGPVLPELAGELGVAPDLVGLVLGMGSLGGLMSVFGGWISDRMSRLFFGALSLLMLAAGAFLLIVSRSLYLVGASLFLLATAAGFLESSVNASISDLYSGRRGLSVNLFHIGWNVGSTIGPSASAFLIVATQSWRNVYLLHLPVLLLFSGILFLLDRNHPHSVNKAQRENLQFSVKSSFKFLPLALIGFFYVGAEMGISNWLAFILEDLGSGVMEAGLAVGLFWGLMGVGRLVWGPIVDRAGYRKPLILTSSLALVCMILASSPLPLGTKTLLWASSGFFLAPTFPTLIAWITSLAPEHGGSLSGLIFTAGTAGIFLSNYIVGLSKAMYGAAASQYVFVLFTATMIVNVLVSHPTQTDRQ